MLTRIVEARYVSDFIIWLRFSDAVEGEVDLRNDLTGPIFEPLRQVEAFRDFHLDPELKTLVWPNGADLAPEFLREQLRAAADRRPQLSFGPKCCPSPGEDDQTV